MIMFYLSSPYFEAKSNIWNELELADCRNFSFSYGVLRNMQYGLHLFGEYKKYFNNALKSIISYVLTDERG